MDEYYIKQAHSAIDSLANELAKAKADLEEQKMLACGKLMPVVEYPMGQCMASIGSYRSPEVARKEVEALYQKCLALKEANQAAIKNNKAVYDGLVKLIAAIGIPSHYTKVVNRRSFKTEKITHSWIDGLRSLVQMHDNWPNVQRTYEQKMADILKWEKELAAKEEAEKRKVEEDIKNIEKIKMLGILADRYGIALTADADEILAAVLEKDKYLALGHALLMNRDDWNEGPYYARCGLDRFEVVTDIDHAIYEEIHGMIVDWQGDGRCFRDADYGYDALFSMADQALIVDYNKLIEYIE